MRKETETYIPTKPCKKGHSLRYSKSKHCVVCSEHDRAFTDPKINRARAAAWRKANPDKARESVKKAHTKNPESVAKSRRKSRSVAVLWRKKNRARLTAAQIARQANQLKRTPSWITAEDKWLIQEIYELAALRSKLTGVKHHVDHIVPLQGAVVSGLHVPANLRVIPWYENARKNNRFAP